MTTALSSATNGITASDWIQIGIALIALCGVLAACYAAWLSWRARPFLMETKEKHSEDLKKVLDEWIVYIALFQTDNQSPPDEPFTVPSHYIENNILFNDLSNHIPVELGVLQTWDSFKEKWLELQKQRIVYFDSIKKQLEKYSQLKALTWAEENNIQNYGITHNCLSWFYTNILNKANGRNLSQPNLQIPNNSPNSLELSGYVWTRTNLASMVKTFLEEVIHNIETEQSSAAEYSLLVEAHKTVKVQQEFEQIKDKLLGKIDETKAIPILTGECKHLKRAYEPLFPTTKAKTDLPELRRFFENTSLSVTFLTFAVVLISNINLNVSWTHWIVRLVIAIVSFSLFIDFSVGLLWPPAIGWYEKVFQEQAPFILRAFRIIFWPAIVFGFLAALFSASINIPDFLKNFSVLLALVWGVYVLVAIYFRLYKKRA